MNIMLAKTNTDVTKMPWWAFLLIVVIVLIVILVIPSSFWQKHRNKKNKTNGDAKKLNGPVLETSVDLINRASEFENNKPTCKKEKFLLGMYSGAGHKTAIRNKSLVYVYPEHDACKLCQEFEGKILSLEKFDNEITTMSEAISKGYHHIGCKHTDVDYYIKETIIPKSPWTVSEQRKFHDDVLNLFKMENEVRNLIFNSENGVSKTIEEDQEKINILKNKIFIFCEEKNLTFTERRLNPYLNDIEKFKYLPIEEEEKSNTN